MTDLPISPPASRGGPWFYNSSIPGAAEDQRASRQGKKKTHADSSQADVMSKASVRRMQTERERNDALRQGLGGTVEWFM